MAANFAALWKDSGLLASTPPFLVVPYEGISLVLLNGVKSLNETRDLQFDRSNLSVTVINPSDLFRHLMMFAENFPSKVRADVLALDGGVRNSMNFGSQLLSIEGSVAGSTASLDYVNGSSRAKMDVFTARRRKVPISFRFIRYQDATGAMNRGTSYSPSHAQGLVDVLNRVYLPAANVELLLKSAELKNINRSLGEQIRIENFREFIVPLRDQSVDVTVFFVGKYKGSGDPLGEAFRDVKCAVVDDSPLQFRAPEGSWPASRVSDETIYYRPGETRTDRDLHIVLAHEIAHLLGADHNDEQDNLMSMLRQDLKLSRGTVRAISAH